MNLPEGSKPLTNTVNTKPTDRGLQVMSLVFTGATNSAIATQLNISEKTVKFHMTKVMKSLNVRSRAQLMAAEIKRLQGLVNAK